MLEKIGALLLTILLAPVIASCVSARKNPDDIEDGVQSKQQIRRWFGEPHRVKLGLQGHLKGCVERWAFEYAKDPGFDSSTHPELLVVDFDAEGIVCDHAFTKSGKE